MPNLRKKIFREKPYNRFIYLRHPLLTDYSMEEAAVIGFLKHHQDDENGGYPYTKLKITEVTGISRPTVEKALKKLKGEGNIFKDGGRIYFSDRFYSKLEDFEKCPHLYTYTRVIFPLMKELKIKLSHYCLLDTYLRLGEYSDDSTADSSYHYYSSKLNLEERTYYNYRFLLEQKGLIEVSDKTVHVRISVREKYQAFAVHERREQEIEKTPQVKSFFD